jgi:hypothetical protein
MQGLKPSTLRCAAASDNQANVRFGLKADIAASPINVRFTPKKRTSVERFAMPLCAKSGLMLIADWACALDVKPIVQTDWTDGHRTDPLEQNTQQSPVFGRNVMPHPVHS